MHDQKTNNQTNNRLHKTAKSGIYLPDDVASVLQLLRGYASFILPIGALRGPVFSYAKGDSHAEGDQELGGGAGRA